MDAVDRKGRGGAEILTIREVAGYLKLPVSTVYRLAERRDLPGHKVGRQWRFHKSVLDDWFRQHAATSRSTVLVVDDEEAIRELMVTALATKTRDVLAAASGDEALEILKRTEVDLVLLDLSMPGLDGLEAIPLLKDAAPSLGIIVFSGFAADRMRGPALALGADRYLEKGEPLDVIRDAVREVALAA